MTDDNTISVVCRITEPRPGSFGYAMDVQGTKANGEGWLSFEEAIGAANRMLERIKAGTEMKFHEG